MTSITFTYNGYEMKIQCNKEDKMKDIIKNYTIKVNKDKNTLLFLYSGKVINEELKLSELITKEEIDKIQILVLDSGKSINDKALIKSEFIICPICGENIIMKINDYKIFLSECQNGHRMNNILLNEFEKTQYIDMSKIICENCQKYSKSETYKNKFFICATCKLNLCPICKSSHDESHIIINYEDKNYKCPKHDNNYDKYCNKCKINICCMCKKEHNSHTLISFEDLIPDEKKIQKYMKNLEEAITILKNNIEKIKNVLSTVEDNMQIYYNIYQNLISNYKPNKINYEILISMQEINNNSIIENINTLNNVKDIKSKINKIFNLYDMMLNKDKSEINLIYDINEDDDTINIFGSQFVKNNKKFCTMIIDGKEYELSTTFDVKNYEDNQLEIKLKGIDNVTDMSYLFYKCSTLSSLHKFSKLNTHNVTRMSDMFYDCSSLTSLPDISKWNTNNVTHMTEMFCGCSSLKHLPDISKWNTSNVTNMKEMFSGCTSLSSLPDISKWNTSNVTNMREMFSGCKSLISLPDISKWNVKNVTNMKEMFCNCSSLSSLPDITKWNINKNTDKNDIFKGCKNSKKK